jgi:hypothetical protein
MQIPDRTGRSREPSRARPPHGSVPRRKERAGGLDGPLQGANVVGPRRSKRDQRPAAPEWITDLTPKRGRG